MIPCFVVDIEGLPDRVRPDHPQVQAAIQYVLEHEPLARACVLMGIAFPIIVNRHLQVVVRPFTRPF